MCYWITQLADRKIRKINWRKISKTDTLWLNRKIITKATALECVLTKCAWHNGHHTHCYTSNACSSYSSMGIMRTIGFVRNKKISNIRLEWMTLCVGVIRVAYGRVNCQRGRLKDEGKRSGMNCSWSPNMSCGVDVIVSAINYRMKNKWVELFA